MQFEYEIQLKDRRRVNVVGEAKITYACDCSDETHDHIDEIEVQSATEVVNDDDAWLEMENLSCILDEIEAKVESAIYAQLDEEAVA
jgi:hypothetical protein